MRFKFILGFILLAGMCVCLTSGDMWSREGLAAYHKSQIAFTSTRDGNAEIYVMDPDGKNQNRLTDNPAEDWDPSWSPDGQRIAFHSNRDGWNVQIYVMNSNGNNTVKLTDGMFDISPSWSPDGEKIVFSSSKIGEGTEIYLIDADGGNPLRLTNPPEGNWEPSWSPDGQRIVFVSRRDGNGEIYVMNSDGTNQKRLTDSPGYEREPAWSPDGEKIAFTIQRARSFEIYDMDADGLNRRRLTNNLVDDMRPAWSPDGRFIAYASSKHVDAILGQRIHLMTANGEHVARLGGEHGGDDDDPDWYNPAGWTVSPAGNQITIWGKLKKLAPNLR